MTKQEIKKLTTIKALLMKDARMVTHDTQYAQGYKNGFNTCRRKVRRILGLLKEVEDK